MRLLLISGSTRRRSTNTAALLAAQALAPEGVDAVLYDHLADLPAFNPDLDHPPLPPLVADLRAQVARADAVLICTPEYAGTLPGSMKNLLDWLVGGTEISDKPVAWVNVAPPHRGDGALATLALVLGYVGADVLRSVCRRVELRSAQVAEDGQVQDPGVRAALTVLLDDLTAVVGGLRD